MSDGTSLAGRRVVLLTPLTPAPGGNGLAMRAGMFLDALAAHCPVDVVIVPIAGPASISSWVTARAARVAVINPVAEGDGNTHALAQLADPYLRARLETSAPIPPVAARAAPTLAAPAVAALGHGVALGDTPADGPTVVVALREYLAPLGINLARHLHADRVVVDLDDDTESLLHQVGEPDAAAAYGRLARSWLPDADSVILASPIEAARVAARYHLPRVETVPNTCPRVTFAPPPPEHDRLLFVGNLTYRPNIDAARDLIDTVLPAVRRRRPAATADIVGNHDGRLSELRATGVVLSGAVEDLAPWYAGADVIVVPLRHGAGTRIKVLEALAYRRPVVATPAAVEGLQLRDEQDLLIAELDAFGDAVVRVLADPALGRGLADHGSRTVADHYAPEIVAPILRRVVLAARAEMPGAGTEPSR